MAECDRASLYIIDGYKYELLESTTARRWMDQINEVRFCGGQGYYNEEGMKSYLSQGNRVIVKFVAKESPSVEQHLKYEEEGLPIGFKLLWTEVSSLVSETGDDAPCDGFMCRGGEFCIDSADAICAERTRLCINKTLQCNGVANCAENDSSDEHNCYSDHIAWTAVGIFSFIFICTILTVILHRISVRREIQKRIRKEVKSQRGQATSQNGHQNEQRCPDSSRTPATVSRSRRMSPAFFTWTRRPTVESISPSLPLQESLLNQNEANSDQNNVWQIAKEPTPQPPRVRLQPLTVTGLSRQDPPLAFENLEISRNAKETFRYPQTAIV
uniref:Uncharacterized protein n=1 Tax=Panagrolaimus sp. JU765 TaxID=591449 RepID=A0AC34RPT5_9BILA